MFRSDNAAQRLAGRHVLVVEDEALLALDIADELERAGGEVEMAASARRALALIEQQEFDAAILDFRLSDGTSLPVAAELKARRVPYFFVTAQSTVPELQDSAVEAPVFDKPMLPHLVRRELERALRLNPIPTAA